MSKLNIQRVLIPVDFSDTSRKAFYTGLAYSRMFDAESHILHVHEPISSFDSSFDKVHEVSGELTRMETGVRRRINELFEKGGIAEVDRRKIKISIAGGKAHNEIVKFAIDNDIDLIVMGTHGYTGMKAILIGNVTERVVRLSPCPVLCIKPDGFESPLAEKIFKEV
jgi:nucleotide-binding universal stress UspA family protein